MSLSQARSADASLTSASFDPSICVVVRQIRFEAHGVLSFDLEANGGRSLPTWKPGAHIDLVLGGDVLRQYSLCGEPSDPHYRIAVRRAKDGRGGSEAMHALRPGDTLQIAAVRNTFSLDRADSYLFIAGGIGITPLLPMVRATARDGIPFMFIYLGRSRGQMAFVDAVQALGEAAVVIETDHEGIPDSRQLLRAQPAAAVYACGPAGLLDDLEKVAPQLLGSESSLHTERFQPTKPRLVAHEAETTLVCSRSGFVVRTDPSMSFLESLRSAGLAIPSSCEMGICGTCQVLVTAGIPQHNDMLLTQAEREAGAFLPCVSRSQSKELTIDL